MGVSTRVETIVTVASWKRVVPVVVVGAVVMERRVESAEDTLLLVEDVKDELCVAVTNELGRKDRLELGNETLKLDDVAKDVLLDELDANAEADVEAEVEKDVEVDVEDDVEDNVMALGF